MNIAIDARSLQDFELTGVGEYTQNIIKNILIEDQENNYFLFFNTTKELPAHAHFVGPNITTVKFNFPNKLLNLLLTLTREPHLDKLIEHRCHSKIDLFILPNINFFRSHCPYIITCHDLSFKIFPTFFSPRSRLWHWLVNPARLYRQAARVITVSENTKRDLQAIFHVSSEKTTTIPSGLKPATNQGNNLQNKYSLPKQYFLTLGTLEPRKNLMTLIEAFELWCQKNNQPIDLVIAGRDGWQAKKIHARAEQSPFTKRIHLINYVAEADKSSLYTGAKIFIFPSYYEGFGFPPLEAMQYGVPVMAADNSALTEVSGDAAYYINAYNVNAIAQGINNLLQPAVAAWYRDRGHERIQNYTWKQTATNLLALIQKLNKKVVS